jgi:hypothetical protein
MPTLEMQVLMQMTEGTVLYKAFNSQKTLKTSMKVFDPLLGDKIVPDNCGYGIRLFVLDHSNSRIIIK